MRSVGRGGRRRTGPVHDTASPRGRPQGRRRRVRRPAACAFTPAAPPSADRYPGAPAPGDRPPRERTSALTSYLAWLSCTLAIIALGVGYMIWNARATAGAV